ncbi:MAG: putative quinol monooxygenase [Rikenellaceae bacterium]
MGTLTVVARITAKPGNRELVKSELIKLIEPTRAEKGCMMYTLHEDNENENFFLFFEKWESYDLWQVHMGQPGLAEYSKATEGAVESFIVHQMSEI